ncbi:hypothetical protein OpiT1DRAFT_00656 [Opitutaceae bacterium TAV1]|nr:hypothetical protein OpiT1DRAFT_00656 [Opitutaceae bacterium TAV1]
MKPSRILATPLNFLLTGVFSLTAFAVQAATLTLTTKEADGGFDGWCSVFWGGKPDDFGPDSKGPILNAGNLRPTAYDRSAAILMFDLSRLKNVSPADIVSVQLSYYVVEAHGSPHLTITHGTKTARELVRGADNAQKVATSVWTSIGLASTFPKKTGSIDVTNSFVADLSAGNAFSSYRIVQHETYGKKQGTFPYGSKIASADNISGYPAPTLTITTR